MYNSWNSSAQKSVEDPRSFTKQLLKAGFEFGRLAEISYENIKLNFIFEELGFVSLF